MMTLISTKEATTTQACRIEAVADVLFTALRDQNRVNEWRYLGCWERIKRHILKTS